MEKIVCCFVGFVVAIVLIGVILFVKDVAAEIKKDRERTFSAIARKEAIEIKNQLWWYDINDFDKRVEKLIDSKLAEKEGENEAAEL